MSDKIKALSLQNELVRCDIITYVTKVMKSTNSEGLDLYTFRVHATVSGDCWKIECPTEKMAHEKRMVIIKALGWEPVRV